MKTRINALMHVNVGDNERMEIVNQLSFSEVLAGISASEELLIEYNKELLIAQKSYDDYKNTWSSFFGMNGGQRLYLINHVSCLEGRLNNLKEFICFLNFKKSQFNGQSLKESNDLNYFDILFVNPSTPADMFDTILKNNYKALALKYHPDKPGDNENKFKELQNAFECLSDPLKRRTYIESFAISERPMHFSYS